MPRRSASPATLVSAWPLDNAQASVDRIDRRSLRACSGRLVHSGTNTRSTSLPADPIDAHIAQDREGMPFHRLPPFCGDFLATPARPIRLIGPLSRFPKGRRLVLALFGKGIAPVSDGDAVCEGPFARFCERDNRKRPKTQIAALAVNRDSLDPRLRSNRRDGQIERRIRAVHSGLGRAISLLPW